MKKLAVFFIVLISLVVIAGCNHSQKTVTRFSSETDEDTGTKTTITKLEDASKTEPAAIEITAKDIVKDTAVVASPKPEKEIPFAITYPTTTNIESDKGYHLIQGTTPKNTDKIKVNGQVLNKYKAGVTKWNYIAAASLGTLQKGQNYYKVSALDNNGNELGSKSFSINYKGIENGTLAKTGNNSILLSMVISVIGYLAYSSLRRPAFKKI
jgi:hypothetical protein